MHVRAQLNRWLTRLGYEVVKLPRLPPVLDDKYRKHQYLADRHWLRLYNGVGAAGPIDPATYRVEQDAGNARKIDLVWTDRSTIMAISDVLRTDMPDPVFGLCHGTRRGAEQQWSREALGCDVIGTEIADSATQFPNTVHLDFHDRVADWVGRADFVYSNSWDHSHDPQAALTVWIEQLRIGGYLVLEGSIDHGPQGASRLDPFGIEPAVLPYLVADWFGNQVVLHRILERRLASHGPHPVWVFLFRRLR